MGGEQGGLGVFGTFPGVQVVPRISLSPANDLYLIQFDLGVPVPSNFSSAIRMPLPPSGRGFPQHFTLAGDMLTVQHWKDEQISNTLL